MGPEHRIAPAPDGGVLLRLPPEERELLLQLREELNGACVTMGV